MSNIIKPGQGLIFMKVGVHAQEDLEHIVQRKHIEFERAGQIFWGYGGSTCHPKTMVQPFAKSIEQEGNQLLIIMNEMNSKHDAPPEVAKEYSEDGVRWEAVPDGVEVRGSRFALVLDELRIEEFEINLADFEVGVGNSRGRRAPSYLIGQADKACLIYRPADAPAPPEERLIKRIGLIATVKKPYAVFVR